MNELTYSLNVSLLFLCTQINNYFYHILYGSIQSKKKYYSLLLLELLCAFIFPFLNLLCILIMSCLLIFIISFFYQGGIKHICIISVINIYIYIYIGIFLIIGNGHILHKYLYFFVLASSLIFTLVCIAMVLKESNIVEGIFKDEDISTLDQSYKTIRKNNHDFKNHCLVVLSMLDAHDPHTKDYLISMKEKYK